MKRILFALMAACSFSLFADTWTDPETEITWTYTVLSGYKVSIGDGKFDTTAISSSITGDLVIPTHIAGYPVTEIKGYAFKGLSQLTSIKIPEGVTSIGNYAFSASSFTSISIPKGVISIGNHAFSNCYNLTSVFIPASISTWGNEGYTFSWCGKLEKVEFEEGLKQIGAGCFYNCTSLKSITIPKSVAKIGDAAFRSCTKLMDVNMSDGLVTLGNKAFIGCESLCRLELPSTLKNVGHDCFSASRTSFKVFVNGGFSGWSMKAFGGYTDSTDSNGAYYPITELYYSNTYKDELSTYVLSISPEARPFNLIAMMSNVDVLLTSTVGGVVSFRNKDVPWGETVEVTATPKEGYVFLGWGSNVEGIESVSQTLTFTMPERSVTLVASFFPKALLETWFNEAVHSTVKEAVEAKIDGETLLTAEQAATKTSATIDAKVEKGELITSDQLQVMAMKTPIIAVEEGSVTLDLALQSASSLDGEWQQVEMDAAEITEEGAISVSVPADEKASFYKFVVPQK